MKIAVPVKANTRESMVADSFGRAPYFLIVDTESENIDLITNTAVSELGGAGIKAAQMIIDNKTDVLLSPRCGENAASVLVKAGIEIRESIKGQR
jgi:predicted Fe-Mo cluster-binding NifX family protein